MRVAFVGTRDGFTKAQLRGLVALALVCRNQGAIELVTDGKSGSQAQLAMVCIGAGLRLKVKPWYLPTLFILRGAGTLIAAPNNARTVTRTWSYVRAAQQLNLGVAIVTPDGEVTLIPSKGASHDHRVEVPR